MKKFFNFSFSVALATLLLSSCSKEQDTPNITAEPSKEQAAADKLTPGQGVFKLLSFDSKDDMINTIRELSQMDEAKRAEWYKAKGNFESQDSFMWAVVNELDNAKSIEEVRDIQKKYSAFFVWNNNEADEDMSPYIPSNEYDYPLVCNRNGEVSIAGKVCNFNTLKSFEETNQHKRIATAKTAGNSSKGPTSQSWDNYLYVYNGKDRKFWAEGIVAKETLPKPLPPLFVSWIGAIRFTAQKKSKLGWWNHYKTSYTISYVGHTSNWGKMLNFFNDLYNNRPSWDTPEFGPHSAPHLGVLRVGEPLPTTMTLKIHSRGTGTAGQGTFNYKVHLQ